MPIKPCIFKTISDINTIFTGEHFPIATTANRKQSSPIWRPQL